MLLTSLVSLHSWRYCKRTRNKILTSRLRGEWERDFEVFLVALPLVSGGSAAKTLFRASHTASYAGYSLELVSND